MRAVMAARQKGQVESVRSEQAPQSWCPQENTTLLLRSMHTWGHGGKGGEHAAF
jgi:hypothetical protein